MTQPGSPAPLSKEPAGRKEAAAAEQPTAPEQPSAPEQAVLPDQTSARRWRMPRLRAVHALLAAVLVLLGVVLALSAFDVRWTRISLNASAETVSFVAAGATRTSEILLRDLAWNGAEVELILPDGAVVRTEYFMLAGGPITLPPIGLADGAEVTIGASGEGARYTLLFSGGDAELEFPLPGGVGVDTGNGKPRSFAGAAPVMRVRGIDRWFHVSGGVVRRDRIAEAIPIRSLTFWREAPAREHDPLLGTLRRGLLVLEDVGGRRVELREGEPLAFGGLDGVLRSAALDGGLVEIQFDGRARDVRSGYTDPARSLMPSLLDRLVNMPAVKAVLAVVAVVTGSLISLVWRRKE